MGLSVSGAQGVKTDGTDPMVLNGYLAWTHDPALGALSGSLPTAGDVYVVKIQVPKTISVTNITTFLSASGVTLTDNQSFVGLYTVSGDTATLVGSSADMEDLWEASAGVKTAALVGGPYTVAGGPSNYCYVGLVANNTAGTQPTLLRNDAASTTATNMGIAAASGLRVGRIGTSATALPASFTVSSGVAAAGNAFLYWAGLS